MRKSKNIGVSMVEILISIAIFSILMMPIVSSIMSAMTSTRDAKTIQYRNEYVENVVEYVKQDSIENIIKGEYFSDIGSYTDGSTYPVTVDAEFRKDGNTNVLEPKLVELKNAIDSKAWVTVSEDASDVVTSNGVSGDVYFPYEKYTLSGKVKLGAKNSTYSYKMEVSNKYYAEKEQQGSYVNPNNLALGIVEDFDHTKVALINGTIANHDNSVSNAFLTKKIEVLKEAYERDPENNVQYEQYMSQATANPLFSADTATRIITVKVSGSSTAGYKVACLMKYHDNCESNAIVKAALEDYNIEYVPFEFEYPVDATTGVATLPNIYLMYNVCLYNNQFSPDDYIALDTSGLDENDDAPVRLFIVQTAATYSDTLVDADGKFVRGDKLYNNNSQTHNSRDHVRIHLVATEDSHLKNVSVYHNFDEPTESKVNKKNSDILYNSSQSGLLGTALSSDDYIPLVTQGAGGIDYANSVAHYGALDTATEESRGLYQIKLWIQEGDTVDTSVNPVMTATKGGDES